jgi:hypothetical protein
MQNALNDIKDTSYSGAHTKIWKLYNPDLIPELHRWGMNVDRQQQKQCTYLLL